MTVGLADSLEASGIERRGQIWPCSSSSDVNSPSSAARIYNKSELTDWRLMGVIQSVWWRGGGSVHSCWGALDGSKLESWRGSHSVTLFLGPRDEIADEG